MELCWSDSHFINSFFRYGSHSALVVSLVGFIYCLWTRFSTALYTIEGQATLYYPRVWHVFGLSVFFFFRYHDRNDAFKVLRTGIVVLLVPGKICINYQKNSSAANTTHKRYSSPPAYPKHL